MGGFRQAGRESLAKAQPWLSPAKLAAVNLRCIVWVVFLSRSATASTHQSADKRPATQSYRVDILRDKAYAYSDIFYFYQ